MLQRIHDLSINNFDLIKAAGKGLCFHCNHVFNYSQSLETTDDNSTVICPNCGEDSVIPHTTPKLSKAMSKEFY